MFNWLKQWFAFPEEDAKSFTSSVSASSATQRSKPLEPSLGNVPTPNTTEAVNSRSNACNRLRLVLLHDRTQLEPSVLDAMREELVQVISKYVAIEKERIEINLETDPNTNTVALVANIPVRSSRAQEAKEQEALTETEALKEATLKTLTVEHSEDNSEGSTPLAKEPITSA